MKTICEDREKKICRNSSNSMVQPKKSNFLHDLDDLSGISSEELELDQTSSEELSSGKRFKCEIVKMAGNGEGTWNCSFCTYTNMAKDYKCVMCRNNTSDRKSNRKSKSSMKKFKVY